MHPRLRLRSSGRSVLISKDIAPYDDLAKNRNHQSCLVLLTAAIQLNIKQACKPLMEEAQATPNIKQLHAVNE
jgi:hypothetical protein